MERKQEIAVVIVPFLAHGHLNPLLHFSLHLSSRGGLPVHFASTSTHNRQVRTRIQGWDSTSLENIHFHDLCIPPFQSPLPDPHAPTKSQSHLQSMLDASEGLRAPLNELFRTLYVASNHVVVIHDPLMSFAGIDALSLPNVEVYRYQCVPAFFLLSIFHTEDLRNRPKDAITESIKLILEPLDGLLTEEMTASVHRRLIENPQEHGTIINTSRAIENEYIELLAKQPSYQTKKLFIVGPTNPVMLEKEISTSRVCCLEWLDKQPVASVVYISFGTTSSISDEQIEQIAIGLQQSKQRFIWMLRDADPADILVNGEESGKRDLKLPENFEVETRGVGIVLRGWGPQLGILDHPSTGAFMSHCGWNSCMEALSFGVPIIAWPMHSDQPRNSIMVTEYLKVGVKVREWDQREKVDSAAEVEEAIKRVMVYDEGKEMRKRVEKISEAVRVAIVDGGSSRTDLDSFIAHITRL